MFIKKNHSNNLFSYVKEGNAEAKTLSQAYFNWTKWIPVLDWVKIREGMGRIAQGYVQFRGALRLESQVFSKIINDWPRIMHAESKSDISYLLLKMLY